MLILPYFERVMIGTTDIRSDNPDDAVATDAEIDYLLAMVGRVFPGIRVDRAQIVFTFSAVRPLPFSDGGEGSAGQISRDHSIRSLPAETGRAYPIHALIGGKWTTFRAFAEGAADLVLNELGQGRRAHTRDLAIGGGRAYPRNEAARDRWLRDLGARSKLPPERVSELFERYGTRAEAVALCIAEAPDKALRALANFSEREIIFLLKHEKVERLDDLLLRRTLIAMLGQVTLALLHELADICAATLGWSATRTAAEIERAIVLLRVKHRVVLGGD